MNKKISLIITGILIVLVASLGLNFYLMLSDDGTCKTIKIKSSEEEYSEKYVNFHNEAINVKKAIYEGSLAAGTSPTEVKYLLKELTPYLSDAEKDEAIAKYINHINYFAATYTNVAFMYRDIIASLANNIDFSTRDAAFLVSDKVLRNLLLEIWDSDMLLLFSASDSSPNVVVDYASLLESYDKDITGVTREYLNLKLEIVTGNVTTDEGEVNYEYLKDFMEKSFKFIYNNPDYAMLNDIAYMYTVAAKMYLGIYTNDYTDITYSEEDMARIVAISQEFDNSPVADVAKYIIEDVEANGKLTSDMLYECIAAFDSLVANT